MNKRQAKKQYKKIHGHNPPKTAVTKYTPEEMEAINEEGFGTDTLTITDVLLIGTQGTVQRLLQDEQTGQIYPVNNVFVSIINNAMVEEDKGEYTVTEPLFNPLRGILWKNNVCKLRAHFRTDDKNIKVLKSLKGVDITPEVPEE